MKNAKESSRVASAKAWNPATLGAATATAASTLFIRAKLSSTKPAL